MQDQRIRRKRLAVIGAAAVDIVSLPGQCKEYGGKFEETSGLIPKTTVPGTTAIRLGGVARNVHEAAFKTGAEDAVLIASIGKGKDPLANILRDGLKQLGSSQEGLIEMDGPTPSVNMILDERGTLEVGVAATQLVEQMSWSQIHPILQRLGPGIVCFDGNVSSSVMNRLVQFSHKHNTIDRKPENTVITSIAVCVVFEPTSDAKACKFLDAGPLNQSKIPLKHFAPNVQELSAFAKKAGEVYPESRQSYADLPESTKSHRFNVYPHDFREEGFVYKGSRRKLPSWLYDRALWFQALVALSFTEYLWVKGGADGVCLFTRTKTLAAGDVAWPVGYINDPGASEPDHVTGIWFRALKADHMVNSIGAGDSMLGAVLAGLSRGMVVEDSAQLDKLVQLGQLAAVASLNSENAVGDLTQGNRYLAHRDTVIGSGGSGPPPTRGLEQSGAWSAKP